MAILKQIAGHTGCARIKHYLERGGRAIEREFMNFYWQLGENEIEPADHAPEGFDWAVAMDATRVSENNHLPYNGRLARTFKHFVISPDPKDRITFDELKALAHTWLTEEFPDFEAAIVYHDDNDGHIPHAHIVVNNTNLKTGRRMHTDDARDLNRDLQKMAKAMELAHFDDDRKRALAKSQIGPSKTPRTHQAIHYSRAEERIAREGGYSWLSDIRSRVDAAKHLSADVVEFKKNLETLGVTVEDSKSRRHRPDWVFKLADQPTCRVCGEKLGALYGRTELTLFFNRQGRNALSTRGELLDHAKTAVTLNDLSELHELARSLSLCSRHHIVSIRGIDEAIARTEKLASSAEGRRSIALSQQIEELKRAKDFLASRNLLPLRGTATAPAKPERTGRTSPRGDDGVYRNTHPSSSSRPTIEPQRRDAVERGR